MNVRRESRDEAYDVVVVGSGLGGLTAGALLAKAGKKVLVVERHDRPGGYAHSFKRKKYTFDAGVHLIGGCTPTGNGQGGYIDALLQLLEVRDHCTFLKVDPFYTAVFPDFKLSVSAGVEEFIQNHSLHFPAEEKAIRDFVRLCGQVNFEIRQYSEGRPLTEAVQRFPTLMTYFKATLGEVMDDLLTDPRLKALLASLWPYPGLPPARLSFLWWSMLLMSYLEEGAYYCQGSFQNLANAFVEGLQKNGGELLLGSRVRRITVKDGQTSGVILENGQQISSPVVISNSDAMQTYEELVGSQYLPAPFLDKLRRMKPSLSAFVGYLATDLDLEAQGASHEMFLFDSWDHSETHRQVLSGTPAGVIINIPTLVDPSLAPPGQHLMSIMTLIPYDTVSSWRNEKAQYSEKLLKKVEKAFPGLEDHITFAEGASPRTMERYTLNQTGAVYGWEASPQQMGSKRLRQEGPLKGLYLAGHWTQPGLGVYGVIVSGFQTARLVLGIPGETDFWKALEGIEKFQPHPVLQPSLSR